MMDIVYGTYLLVFLSCKVVCDDASPWTIDLPSSVRGLPGSCVVIPCSFDFPSSRTPVREFTGLWFNEGNHLVYHSAGKAVLREYNGRMEMLGDVGAKNCSLKIDPLRQSDKGPFHFRIEMQDFQMFSYSGNTVSIQMIRDLRSVNMTVKEETDNNNMIASCSVTHSCPASPPVFSWSCSGQQQYEAQVLTNGQWKATSTLTFTPHANNKDKHVECSVTYKGGQQQKESRPLNIKYAPVDVKVEYKVDVKEGDDVRLKCSCDANPPASSYEWHDDLGARLYRGPSFNLLNVSRHMGVLYCTAINVIGKTQSGPLQLDVAYAPVIKASSCSSERNMVKCVCIAESNPPSSVHFLLPNGTALPEPEVEIQKPLTNVTLQTLLPSFGLVYCVVKNRVGSARVNITLAGKMPDLYIYIISAAGAVGVMMVIIVIIVMAKKCGRTSNISALQAQKTVAPLQTVTKGARKKASCGQTSMYSDHTYGNLGEVEWTADCNAIYSNL
ncbi:myelin-associated glycoprotein isoform X1 [Nerophis lumbriciformis]|uniref:myelin-associated glycoprotein isoform X1 n=2 Tax=Nerophis lumbriciformis TaxID=546530 RepID=UPI002ADF1438|nr:myelin-associated glycoprotein-like isoform X1 [Nerophis lumbriciformis]